MHINRIRSRRRSFVRSWLLTTPAAAVLICYLLLPTATTTTTALTTFVREPNSRGPAAVESGLQCLMRVARTYFNSTRVSRTRNMVVMHSAEMSAPAADIEVRFLAYMHEVIASNQWKGLQLCIISNRFSTRGLIEVDANAVTLTDYYVLVIDDVQKLHRNMLRYIVVGRAYNPGARFVVMYAQPGAPLEQKRAAAQWIFQQMFRYFGAARVIVCVSAGYLKYDVYRTDPYRNATNCGSLMPLAVGQCSNGRFVQDAYSKMILGIALVPPKMSGCVFNICARVTQPYIEEECRQGLEVQLLRTMEQMMDFTQIVTCSLQERGDREPNSSWSGLLAELVDKDCDLLVGGFFPDNDVHVDFAVTTTYMQDSYTWYVFVAQLQEPWRGLIAIFEPLTWLLFVLLLGVASAAWLFFGSCNASPLPAEREPIAHRRPALVCLNTWSVFLSVSANNRPEQTPLRIFFIMLALYGLNVTTIYTSNLITMFTDPRHDHQLDSIDEIIEAEMPLGGREEYSDWFENDAPDDERVRVRYKFSDQFMPRVRNLERVRDGEQAMLMNRYYVLSSELRDELFAVPGNVFSSPVEMIARRGFPLLYAIDRLINRMKDSGLLVKINADFLFAMNVREAVRRAQQGSLQGGQKVLSINHLQGAFAILIIGLLGSGVVFVGELVAAKKPWAKAGRRKIAGKEFGKYAVRKVHFRHTNKLY